MGHKTLIEILHIYVLHTHVSSSLFWCNEDNYPAVCHVPDTHTHTHIHRMIILREGLTPIKHNIIQDLGWAAQKTFSPH